ncbi:DNA/RNA helicase domain-containing protein [Lactobacillus apis]|uniref:DNA/RNA helicase domain-containing protein n=1 Tax=Lactobacillus apis TaxID=303541 RepID=UPI0016504145|nr:DNA/RNA helicase domain-containing protein [Lactobacillus apis]MBC6362072.1 DUF2075 domain-containing protein [Lactobacillus apis]
MQYFDLRSLIATYQKSQNGANVFEEYCDYIGSTFKPQEITDITNLLSNLSCSDNTNGFYFNFSIPQISKEFDLLRFSEKLILNIELKSGNKTENEIRHQLLKNKYYLSSFDKGKREVKLYTYERSSNTLFELTDSDLNKLEKNNWSSLKENLNREFEEVNIASLCDTNTYLISPFNNTKRFLNSEYFLTDQQEKIKKEIIENPNCNYFIKGAAGTGKTLLVYDIAKSYLEKSRILIIHCANLNEGQETLNTNGFSIKPIKDIYSDRDSEFNFDFSPYDVIIVDEVQRIHSPEIFFKNIFKFHGQIIFSGDKKQCLNKNENSEEVFNIIDKNEHNVITKELNKKIRNNKEISCFIKQLFEYRENTEYPKNIQFKNIHIAFFNDTESAVSMAKNLKQNNWTLINLTTSKYSSESYDVFTTISDYTSHKVIGQEFDKVATFIGPNFEYLDNGKLRGFSTYYPAAQTLFENVTRAKNKLYIIVFNNFEVFSKCVQIVNEPKSEIDNLKNRNNILVSQVSDAITKLDKITKTENLGNDIDNLIRKTTEPITELKRINTQT